MLSGDFIEFSIDSDISLNPFSNITAQDSKEESDFLSLLLPVIAKMAAPKRGTTDIEDSIIASTLQNVWSKYKNQANIDLIIEEIRPHSRDMTKSCVLR